jgi:hypothetical protein
MYLTLLVLSLFAASLLVNVVFVFRYLWTGSSKIRYYSINLSVLVLTFLFLFLIAEHIFYYVIVQSDGCNFTLSAKRWQQKYWTPVNSLGYRDDEHTGAQLEGRKTVFVVGDSFAAGYGIKDYRDRFSGVLQKKMGEGSVVITVANPGWDTAREYEGIVSYPHKPDVIALIYLINDIESAARKKAFYRPTLIPPPGKIVKTLVMRSYFLDFVYWRLYRFKNVDIEQVYWGYIKECYSNEEIWRTHKDELLDIVNYARDNGAELIVVVFPQLQDIEGSRVFTSNVTDFLVSNKVRVIDLTDILAGRNPMELVVNPVDAHPNEGLHEEVAELLFEQMQEL